jgi:diacylglycerol kinase family enzyme
VVVAGGDGTIACAAQVLVGTDTPLGILPSGTMNLLAKDLGIPIGDMDAAIALLAHGKPRRIDVGEVDGRVFLCASMLDLPADLGRHREAQRAGGPGWQRWARFARAILRTGRRYVARRLLLEFPDGAVASRAPSITVVVNRLDDSSGRLFARTRLDGGEFGVYLAQRPRVREIVPLALDLLRGSWHAGGAIEERRAPALTIRARRLAIRVMNDGEAMILPLPLRYRLRPAALSVIAPVA